MPCHTVCEIAPDVYRIRRVLSRDQFAVAPFLANDDEPLLFHSGLRRMFPDVREGVSKVLDPATIRWISFSHFEADECGALNEWFAVAPRAQAACGMVGGLVSVNDFTGRETRILTPKEPLATGKYRFRYLPNPPDLPHGWDAGVMFEETGRTLFCSDLFHHDGEVEPLTHSSILYRVRQT